MTILQVSSDQDGTDAFCSLAGLCWPMVEPVHLQAWSLVLSNLLGKGLPAQI